MFCTQCGKKAEEGTKFCTNCGTPLEVKTPEEEAPVVAFEEPIPITPPPSYTEPQPAIPVAPPVTPVSQPVVTPPPADNLSPTVSTATFFWMDLVLAIPVVGLIVCIVLACGATSRKSLRNWAKARLIWALVGVILSLILMIVAVSLPPRYYALLFDFLNQL